VPLESQAQGPAETKT